jgi:hypothetical protein
LQSLFFSFFYFDKEVPHLTDNKKDDVTMSDLIHGIDVRKEGDQANHLTIQKNGHTYEIVEPDMKEEYQKIRPEPEIKVPDNFVKMVDQSIKDYRKWLFYYNELISSVNNIVRVEEKEEVIQKAKEMFRERYAGIVAKDEGIRLSPAQVRNIWEKFMRDEYRGFLRSHVNITLKDILDIGVDKFIYTLGWNKPSQVVSWHNNRVRIGICCHCKDQFIPMMLQYNHGLCRNCRPTYSHKAIRHFILHQLNVSERYNGADKDMMMDFYIMFYHDDKFRSFFIKNSEEAKEIESLEVNVPDWVKKQKGIPMDDSTEGENNETT